MEGAIVRESQLKCSLRLASRGHDEVDRVPRTAAPRVCTRRKSTSSSAVNSARPPAHRTSLGSRMRKSSARSSSKAVWSARGQALGFFTGGALVLRLVVSMWPSWLLEASDPFSVFCGS